MNIVRIIRRFGGAAAFGAVVMSGIPAADPPVTPPRPASEFEQQSLALRTALFYEPSLDQPLRNLIKLYGEAGRLEELLALYRTHVAQYRDDAGSHAVLLRLLQELKRPEASSVAQAAAEAHPEFALLHYLRHLDLEAQRDPRSLDVLSLAIEKESDAGRKRTWINKLVTAATAEDRRELAGKHLRALAQVAGQSAETLSAIAQRMVKERFFELALESCRRRGKGRAIPGDVGRTRTPGRHGRVRAGQDGRGGCSPGCAAEESGARLCAPA